MNHIMTVTFAAFTIVVAVIELIDSGKPNQGYSADGSLPNNRIRGRTYGIIPVLLILLLVTFH